jgi:hypothetical protein
VLGVVWCQLRDTQSDGVAVCCVRFVPSTVSNIQKEVSDFRMELRLLFEKSLLVGQSRAKFDEAMRTLTRDTTVSQSLQSQPRAVTPSDSRRRSRSPSPSRTLGSSLYSHSLAVSKRLMSPASSSRDHRLVATIEDAWT